MKSYELNSRYELMRGHVSLSWYDNGHTNSYNDGACRLYDDEEGVFAFNVKGDYLFQLLHCIKFVRKDISITWDCRHHVINDGDTYQVFLVKKYGFNIEKAIYDCYFEIHVSNLSEWRRSQRWRHSQGLDKALKELCSKKKVS